MWIFAFLFIIFRIDKTNMFSGSIINMNFDGQKLFYFVADIKKKHFVIFNGKFYCLK